MKIEEKPKPKEWFISTHKLTSEGEIQHKIFCGLRMPVKLDLSVKIEIDERVLNPPLRYNGRLVYALPGGREFVE